MNHKLYTATVKEYTNLLDWQNKEIENGIAEADAGQLIEHKDVLMHWQKKLRSSIEKLNN